MLAGNKFEGAVIPGTFGAISCAVAAARLGFVALHASRNAKDAAMAPGNTYHPGGFAAAGMPARITIQDGGHKAQAG